MPAARTTRTSPLLLTPFALCLLLVAACGAEDMPADEASSETDDVSDGGHSQTTNTQDGGDTSGSEDDGDGEGEESTTSGEISEPECLILPEYPGTLYEAQAFIGNPDSLQPFLSLNANLEAGAYPDRLVLFGIDQGSGFATGTFPLPTGPWSVSLCADFDLEGFPICSLDLYAVSGTLQIDSVEGVMTGSIQDLAFETEDGACTSRIDEVQFSVTIE